MKSKERSDLSDLIAAAIKAGSRDSIVEAKRCIDVLDELKSLSLCSKDLLLSTSIIQLEILREHRNPLVRREVHNLINSWREIIYTTKKDNTIEATVTKAGPKIKLGPALTITKEHVKLKKPLLNKEEDDKLINHRKRRGDDLMNSVQKNKAFKFAGDQKIRFDSIRDCFENSKMKIKTKNVKVNDVKVGRNRKMCFDSSGNFKCSTLMNTKTKEVKKKLMYVRKKIIFSDDESD